MPKANATRLAVAQHPSHPTGTLLRQEPRDESAWCSTEVPNGASVRVLGTHDGRYTRVAHAGEEGFIKTAYLTFPVRCNVEAMGVKALKAFLNERGVSFVGVTEKLELVALARTAQAEEDDQGDEQSGELCSLCYDARVSAQDAGEKAAEKCTHARSVCDGCLRRHVEAEVRGKGNCRRISCPEPGCHAVMEHHKVQRWAVASVFEAYDQLLLRDCLQSDAEFRWCARPGCGYGQKHRGKDDTPIMTCYKCRGKTCFTHRCEWHENRTCSQYDRDAEEREEVALLQSLENGRGIKRCPKCGEGIEKNEGCDHMTCKKPGGCGHEFCWRCLAPYDGADGIRQVGNTAHAPSCLYHM